MKYLKTKKITAITAMAVICMVLLVSGCATKRDIEAINDRIAQLEMNTRRPEASKRHPVLLGGTGPADDDAHRELQ
jgi:hypothetical protein